VIVMAAAAATVPMRQAAACSCIGFRTPEEHVAEYDVTFIGTVIDTARDDANGFGGTVRYAFDVERASAPTDAVLVVQAVDDGGAMCGFSFAMGERWLVSAYRQDAALETSLCSNNQRADDMAAADQVAYAELLPNIPPPPAAPDEPPPSDLSIPLTTAAAGLGALGLVAVIYLAFRGSRARRD
jgi:hypothetical protein